MIGPTDVEGQTRNNGHYDPFAYRFWSYPKTARNFRENIASEKGLKAHATSANASNEKPVPAERILRPAFLFFLNKRQRGNTHGLYDREKWIREERSGQEPSYIFVSYTAQGQFRRRCKKANQEIREFGSSNCQGKLLLRRRCPQGADTLIRF